MEALHGNKGTLEGKMEPRFDPIIPLTRQAEIDRLRLFLIEIAKGAGAYKRDPLEHCRAVIEDSVNLARAALRDPQEGNRDVVWDERSYEAPK